MWMDSSMALDPAVEKTLVLLDSVLAHVVDGVIVLDAGKRITMINPGAIRMLNLEGWSFVGRAWEDLLAHFPDGSSLGQILTNNHNRHQQPETCQVQLPVITDSGRTLLISAHGLPDNLEGVLPGGGHVLIVREIGEAARAYREVSRSTGEARGRDEETADALAALAQAIAHEIRNPVMVIGGFARILQRHHPQLEYVNEIILNSQRLEAVVQDVADYATLPPVRFQDEDPVSWLQELIASFEAEARQHHVKMVFTHSWPEGLKLRFDLLLMRKVLRILFENALEAMQGGLGEIHVRLQPADHYAQVEMIDSGLGIKPEHLPYVFDPFFTTKPKSLGMGLTKAERILAKHGGRFDIEPAKPHGTRVRLWLPLETCTTIAPADPLPTDQLVA
jgi:signal transduction histidine kinase